MATTDKEKLVTPRLTAEEAELNRAAQLLITTALDHSRAGSIKLVSDDLSQPEVALPPQTLRVISRVLGLMSQGGPITLMPEKQEFSTVEAANFLNVSRPFVIKEMAAGRLPHRMVGSHRRVLYQDLRAYAETMRAGQKAALDRMAENARELGLDY